MRRGYLAGLADIVVEVEESGRRGHRHLQPPVQPAPQRPFRRAGGETAANSLPRHLIEMGGTMEGRANDIRAGSPGYEGSVGFEQWRQRFFGGCNLAHWRFLVRISGVRRTGRPGH